MLEVPLIEVVPYMITLKGVVPVVSFITAKPPSFKVAVELVAITLVNVTLEPPVICRLPPVLA